MITLAVFTLAFFGTVTQAFGADSEAKLLASNDPEHISVDNIKAKYWANGDDSELGVVQNRAYSKSRKFETGVFGGIVASDPFLSVKTTGGSLGFHFSEYLSAHVVGWKAMVAPSTALKTFEETIGASTNNNPPRWYLGAEGSASLLYGKLSLVGKAIIYYDFHALGGLGYSGTESGSYLSPSVGVGQQVYLSKLVSLRVDYRLFRFSEQIVEKVITPKLGQLVGERVNWSNSVTLGITFLMGGRE